MKKFGLVIASLLFFTNVNPVFGAVKAGASCSKVGTTSVIADKKFTCIKSGKKLIWDKGINVKSETMASTESKYFKSPCDIDPNTPMEWKQIELQYFQGNGCASALRIPKTTPLVDLPKFANNLHTVDISQCKIEQNNNKQNTLGFKLADTVFNNNLKNPSPNTVYQIVPIYSDDIPDSKTNPQIDFKKYFDFIKDWTEQASDNGSNVQIRVPDHYLYMPKKIASYNLTEHHRKQDVAERFANDFLKYMDPQIDFSGSNIVMIVFPPSTNSIVTVQISLGVFNTSEGIQALTVMPSNGPKAPINNFMLPSWWMHELMHVALGFDDNSQDFVDAMGWWGLINWASTYDLLAWHKWISGFISDSQVICLSKNSTSTAYIAPLTRKSTRTKMIVIPIDRSRVLVIESQRAQGINYKLPEISEGALVYLVDTNLTGPHDGIRLIIPSNKQMINTPLMDKNSTGPNSNSVLKLGESSQYANVKITVIESGTYGDVLKIENT